MCNSATATKLVCLSITYIIRFSCLFSVGYVRRDAILKVSILALADLKVTETVKEGKTIFNAK